MGSLELDTTKRLSGEGNGTPLQYSCLENPLDGGAWWVTVHGVAELDTTKRLSTAQDTIQDVYRIQQNSLIYCFI